MASALSNEGYRLVEALLREYKNIITSLGCCAKTFSYFFTRKICKLINIFRGKDFYLSIDGLKKL